MGGLGGLFVAPALDPWGTVPLELASAGSCAPPVLLWAWTGAGPGSYRPGPDVLVSLRLFVLRRLDPSTTGLADTTGLGEGGLHDHCALSVAVVVALLGSQRQRSAGHCLGDPAVEESQDEPQEQSEEREEERAAVPTAQKVHFHGEMPDTRDGCPDRTESALPW